VNSQFTHHADFAWEQRRAELLAQRPADRTASAERALELIERYPKCALARFKPLYEAAKEGRL
jgi:hypothetical protein